MANILLNSTYGVWLNFLSDNATIGPYRTYLEFNSNCYDTFNGQGACVTSIQDIATNISMNNITNASCMFNYCYNLTGSPVCPSSILDASSMYYLCYSLTGSPVCGINVTNARSMYYNCQNLTGSPVCGSNVIDANYMYYNCQNLTGSPVCGSNVIDANYMYQYCYNLTGSPVCGDNVTSAHCMYYSCRNLTGSPVCGSKVINARNMYYYCNNLKGSGNVYMNNVNDCLYMLRGRKSTAGRINLFINPSKLNLQNTSSSKYNILGRSLTWITMTGGYYNASYNIYVYTNAT